MAVQIDERCDAASDRQRRREQEDAEQSQISRRDRPSGSPHGQQPLLGPKAGIGRVVAWAARLPLIGLAGRRQGRWC